MADVVFDENPLVYSMGVCAASVCIPKDMNDETLLEWVNAQNPTGIESQWVVSDSPTFKGGEPNGCPCSDYPSERIHKLLEC